MIRCGVQWILCEVQILSSSEHEKGDGMQLIFFPDQVATTIVSDTIQPREKMMRMVGRDGMQQFEKLMVSLGLDYTVSHVCVKNPQERIENWVVDYSNDTAHNAYRVTIE